MNIEKLKKEEVPAEELQKVKNNFAARRISPACRPITRFCTRSSITMAKATGARSTLKGRKIQAVTAADVKRVANEYFTKENRTVAIYTRKPGTTPSDTTPGRFTLNAFAMKKIYQIIIGRVPKGQNENSPAFQRRDDVPQNRVPKGRMNAFGATISAVPAGLGARLALEPGVKTPGYFRLFLRNKSALLAMRFGRSVLFRRGSELADSACDRARQDRRFSIIRVPRGRKN